MHTHSHVHVAPTQTQYTYNIHAHKDTYFGVYKLPQWTATTVYSERRVILYREGYTHTVHIYLTAIMTDYLRLAMKHL